MTKLTVVCSACNEPSSSPDVTYEDLKRYAEGELVQNVWPDFTDDEREIIISARTGAFICSKCWDNIFGEEE